MKESDACAEGGDPGPWEAARVLLGASVVMPGYAETSCTSASCCIHQHQQLLLANFSGRHAEQLCAGQASSSTLLRRGGKLVVLVRIRRVDCELGAAGNEDGMFRDEDGPEQSSQTRKETMATTT